jgi:hypothetical protein
MPLTGRRERPATPSPASVRRNRPSQGGKKPCPGLVVTSKTLLRCEGSEHASLAIRRFLDQGVVSMTQRKPMASLEA